jgi:hypothetical protein
VSVAVTANPVDGYVGLDLDVQWNPAILDVQAVDPARICLPTGASTPNSELLTGGDLLSVPRP